MSMSEIIKLSVRFDTGEVQELAVPTEQGAMDYELYTQFKEAFNDEYEDLYLEQLGRKNISTKIREFNQMIQSGQVVIQSRFGYIQEVTVAEQ